MNLSYWEYDTWLSNVDFTIVGGGIVGLSCAIFLKKRYPKANVLVLERGSFPQGASTKNAGFACFGSLSEILSDLQQHDEQEVFALIYQRFKGIQNLRDLLGDEALEFEQSGGYELFLKKDKELYEKCLSKLDEINNWISPIFGEKPFVLSDNNFGFGNIYPNCIKHGFEGQLNTGKMMAALIKSCHKMGITILNAVEVLGFDDGNEGVKINTTKFEFSSRKLIIATNGFASELLNKNIEPARAQVLITKPIKNLKINGTFHFEKGYYYFRNINDRILFGGGRNLDFKTEATTQFGQTEIVQEQLDKLLREVILPNSTVEIERRWSGIMGTGPKKTPIVEQLTDNVCCGVRLGGMGIAIGSLVGKELSRLV